MYQVHIVLPQIMVEHAQGKLDKLNIVENANFVYPDGSSEWFVPDVLSDSLTKIQSTAEVVAYRDLTAVGETRYLMYFPKALLNDLRGEVLSVCPAISAAPAASEAQLQCTRVLFSFWRKPTRLLRADFDRWLLRFDESLDLFELGNAARATQLIRDVSWQGKHAYVFVDLTSTTSRIYNWMIIHSLNFNQFHKEYNNCVRRVMFACAENDEAIIGTSIANGTHKPG